MFGSIFSLLLLFFFYEPFLISEVESKKIRNGHSIFTYYSSDPGKADIVYIFNMYFLLPLSLFEVESK